MKKLILKMGLSLLVFGVSMSHGTEPKKDLGPTFDIETLESAQRTPQNAWVNPGKGWIQLECVPPRHDCGFDCCRREQTCSRDGRCVTPLRPPAPPPPPPPPPILPIIRPPPRPRPPPLIVRPAPRSIRQRPGNFCPEPTKVCGDLCCRRTEECVANLYCVQPKNCDPPGVPCGSSCCAPWERCVAGVCGRVNSYCQFPRIVCGTECCEAWETCDFARKYCFDARNSRRRSQGNHVPHVFRHVRD